MKALETSHVTSLLGNHIIRGAILLKRAVLEDLQLPVLGLLGP